MQKPNIPVHANMVDLATPEMPAKPESQSTEPESNNADIITEPTETLSTTEPEISTTEPEISTPIPTEPSGPEPEQSQHVATPPPATADPDPAHEPAPEPQEHHVISVMQHAAEYEEDDMEILPKAHGNRHKSGHFGKGFLIGALCSLALIGIVILAWRIILPDSYEAVISALGSDRQTEITNHAVTAKVVSKPQTESEPQQIIEPDEIAKPIEPVESDESADVPTETSDKQLTADTDIKEKSTNESPAHEPEIFTDKITKKRYLTTMAREYYGNYNLWPLIYDYNAGLGHPDRIRPGTKIKVPSAEALGIDPKDPAVIKKAKNRGAEIYRKYKKS